MSDPPPIYRAPLPVGTVVRDAFAMLRVHFVRVAGAAMVFFVPLAVVRHVAHDLTADLPDDVASPFAIVLVVFVLAGSAVAVFGPVMYAGFLEAAVGAEHFGEGRRTIGEVLRTLPWGRLVLADLVVVVVTGIALSPLVLPGLLVATLLALTGPLISMERLHTLDALRYSARLVWPHLVKVFLLVVVPLNLEHAVEALLEDVLGELPLVLDVGITWAIAVLLYAFIGLMEVSIAYRLVHRADRARRASEARAPRHPVLERAATPTEQA